MKLEVTDFLPQGVILRQLAEEAAELSQAALKLDRVIDGRNPTPVGYMAAVEHLNEEIADVRLCTDLLGSVNEHRIHEIKNKKHARWILRLIENQRKEEAVLKDD